MATISTLASRQRTSTVPPVRSSVRRRRSLWAGVSFCLGSVPVMRCTPQACPSCPRLQRGWATCGGAARCRRSCVCDGAGVVHQLHGGGRALVPGLGVLIGRDVVL